jgi:hypothetical protein
MHTRELAHKTSTKFNEIQEIASKLSTCPDYTPTSTEQILIAGAQDPTMVKQVMSSINCLMRNPEFTIALTQPVIEKSYEKDMAFFQTKFENQLPMIEGIEELKLLSAPVGKQLVLYENPHENDDAALEAKIVTIKDILFKTNPNGKTDILKTRELIEFLAAKSPEEFSDWLHLESFIPGQHPDSPSSSPSRGCLWILANVNGNPSNAITGTQTKLLTLQNSTIVDNSSYGLTITNTNSCLMNLL